jgi:putative hemolysin
MPGSPFSVGSRTFSRLSGLEEIERLYSAATALGGAPFEDRALSVLDVHLDARGLAVIPRSGALIVVANHPHGAIDGLALLSLVGRVRSDVRILANRLLDRIPELRERAFFVDPFGSRDSARRSRIGLRAAIRWLRRGGGLIVFPAGEVAHTRSAGGERLDSAWHDTAGRLAAATKAAVAPAFIEGRNSWSFYAAGRLHSALRTLLLPREMLKQRGTTLRVTFTEPLARPRHAEPVVAAIPASDLDREVSRLPPDACLLESAPFQVFCADAASIPRVVREIGRLREITFRLAGEGTGNGIDLDQFDHSYKHLFLWDRSSRSIVGAYRIGLTDQLLADRGVDALYTRRLFRFDKRLFDNMPPALELGRSFVREEYQRRYSSLLLLWKGIGQFVLRYPHYRVLFGPVSISTRYSDTSHRLLMQFLLQNHRRADLAHLVEAVNPQTQAPPSPTRGAAVPSSVTEADDLVSQIERDGKGLPILLRQYLKLNARVLGFNVDPEFGDALDALMMVDLAEVDPAILRRYFGREGAALFATRHRSRSAAA